MEGQLPTHTEDTGPGGLTPARQDCPWAPEAHRPEHVNRAVRAARLGETGGWKEVGWLPCGSTPAAEVGSRGTNTAAFVGGRTPHPPLAGGDPAHPPTCPTRPDRGAGGDPGTGQVGVASPLCKQALGSSFTQCTGLRSTPRVPRSGWGGPWGGRGRSEAWHRAIPGSRQSQVSLWAGAQ